MKPKKQVVAATMKDVALKANVSTATVSRALMNPDKVSQATRNRVEQAALEVGYLPQSLGRNLCGGVGVDAVTLDRKSVV